jgi:DNA-binding MarR family transcriptional regulator
MLNPNRSQPLRADLLRAFATAGREHSDATVLFHATVAAQLGLNVTDEKTLSVLQRLGPLSAREIAVQTGLAPSSVTNLIDRLEAKGFVRRRPDPTDRRRITIEPMGDRIAESKRLFESTSESLAVLVEHYSDQELGVIADFLTRNAERLRAETGKLSTHPAIETANQ